MLRLKIWLASIGAVLVALGAAYWRGKSNAEETADRERLKSYVEARKRIDEVGRMSDADAAADWLRERNK